MTSTTLELIRGDTAILDVVASEPGGSPVDLSVVDMWFTAKHRVTDSDDDAVFRKTPPAGGAGGIELTSAIDGEASVRIDADDWSAYSGTGSLVWDLQIRVPPQGGEAALIVTVAHGTIKVIQDVTLYFSA